MKIALFTSGQPRFSESLILLQEQLKGVTEAHIYMILWPSIEYPNSRTVIEKTSKYLSAAYSYKYIEVRKKEPNWFDDSKYLLRRNRKLIPSNILKMWYGLKETFDKIPKNYDAYIRFRLDGRLSCQYDLNSYNLDSGIVMPVKPRYGYDFPPTNDQFAIGNYYHMKEYCDMIDYIDLYYADGIPLHAESYLGYHLFEKRKINILPGKFSSIIKQDPPLE